ncbi:hypothetical protein [Neolewinella persica]|uniref:hypothetical protein n=1 Tax=Neolewinella persica TaxID=70998 RepID=UPI0012FBEE85|nr:hypothetical protein [Neolewinella persica]
MFRLFIFILLLGSFGTLQAQTATGRQATNGLCGNYDGDDDCRLRNDEVFPGSILDLEIVSCVPDVATISLRRMADGQPLVEVARRLSAGRQVISVGIPDFAEPGIYRLEVGGRTVGAGIVVYVLE